MGPSRRDGGDLGTVSSEPVGEGMMPVFMNTNAAHNAPALFAERDGWFHPSPRTAGPWDPANMHGGPVSGLLARAIEQAQVSGDLPGLAPFVARLTVEMFRPVPLVPLRVSTEVLRPGKKIQLVGASLWADDETELARATGLRIRRQELGLQPTVAAGIARVVPRVPFIPLPDDAPPVQRLDHASGFYAEGCDMRQAKGAVGTVGPGAIWVRLLQPLIEHEPLTPFVRTACLADFGNATSSAVPRDLFAFPNADLTVSLHREAVGDWIGLEGVSRVGPEGVGLAAMTVHDATGPIGHSAQSLVILPQ